ncbi:MAG: hypothetical protein KF777_02585 [Planctomycetaceae bacterium]|nr:hypothetical protein [Planctomycetaceae bacterium]
MAKYLSAPGAQVPNSSVDARSASGLFLEFTDGAFQGLMLPVEGDEFQIGRAATSDLELMADEAPVLHSVVRRQGAAVWIESLDPSAKLMVNGQNVRRMALRDGDEVRGSEFAFRVRGLKVATEESVRETGISRLSAEELCDLIAAEEQEIATFENGRLAGMRSLIEAALGEQTVAAQTQGDTPRLERILTQVQELTEAFEVRADSMARREQELLEAALQMQSLQQRMNEQLSALLHQAEGPSSTDLRAIA